MNEKLFKKGFVKGRDLMFVVAPIVENKKMIK